MGGAAELVEDVPSATVGCETTITPRPINNLTVELTDWGAHDRAAGSKDPIAARLDRLPRPFPMS
jgi:hypothetical protein